MSSKVIEKTITDLKRRVAKIEASMNESRAGWKKIVGAAKDDRYFAEAMRLGAKWRKQANQENW